MKQVCLRVIEQTFTCQVGVVPQLDCQVLLGWDCPFLPYILAASAPAGKCDGSQAEEIALELPSWPSGLEHLNKQDDSLHHVLAQARESEASSQQDPQFLLKEGILYGQDGDVVQLVVPHPLWESALGP